MPRKRGNGDGTIYKMESKGLWAAQLTIGVDANGKPKRKTIYGKRQAGVRTKYWIYCMIIIHWILSGEIMISYGWVLPAEMMRAYAV